MDDSKYPLPPSASDDWLVNECRDAMLKELARQDLPVADKERTELLIYELHTTFLRVTRQPITSFKLQSYFATATEDVPYGVFRDGERVKKLLPGLIREGLRSAKAADEIDSFVRSQDLRKP